MTASRCQYDTTEPVLCLCERMKMSIDVFEPCRLTQPTSAPLWYNLYCCASTQALRRKANTIRIGGHVVLYTTPSTMMYLAVDLIPVHGQH